MTFHQWSVIHGKGNLNSTIYTNKNKTLFLKSLLLAPDDFKMIKSGDQKILEYDNVLVWKELQICLLLYNFLKNNNLPYLKFHDSSLFSDKSNKFYLNLMFEYVPMTLKEYILSHPNSVIDTIIQIFFQCYYLDLLHIHHFDLHARNVLVKLTKKKNLKIFFEGKRYVLQNQSVECFLIDFGFAKVDATKSNFWSFKKFIKQLEKDLGKDLFLNIKNSWKTSFPFIKNHLKIDNLEKKVT